MRDLTTQNRTPNSKAACRASHEEGEKWEVKWKPKRKPITLPPTILKITEDSGRTVPNEPGKWATVDEGVKKGGSGVSFKVKKYSKVVDSQLFPTEDD